MAARKACPLVSWPPATTDGNVPRVGAGRVESQGLEIPGSQIEKRPQAFLFQGLMGFLRLSQHI